MLHRFNSVIFPSSYDVNIATVVNLVLWHKHPSVSSSMTERVISLKCIDDIASDCREIGEMCRARKIFFHSDAAQAVGKIPVNVKDMNVDLMSIRLVKAY